MSDKLKQIQDVLGFNGSSTKNTTNSNTAPAEPTSTIQATTPDVPLDADLEEEFQQHFTYHSFASHPLSKLSLVALGTAGVVGFLVLFYSLFQNPMGNLQASNGGAKSRDAQTEELFAQESEKREKEELLAQLALSQQAQQMKRHQIDKKSDAPAQPSLKEKPETPKSRISQQNVTPTSPRRTRAVARQSSRDLSTSSYNQRPYRINQVPVKPREIISRQPLVRSIKPSSKAIDPQKQWQDLAALGSFKAKVNNSNASSPRPIPLVAEADDKTTVSDNPSTVLVSQQKVTSNHSEQNVPVQKLNGRIEGGLAVPANTSVSPNRDSEEELLVSIVLNEPIKDRLSKSLVPSGARLTAMVKVNGPMISFIPRKLAYEIEGQYQEVELQPDAIAISGKDGPVIAEVRTVGEDGGGLSVNQLGQLAGALGGLAGIEKATNFALVFNALSGGSNRRTHNNGIRIYTVNDGTSVTVRLTRPLALPLGASTTETATPELDFE
ncbi:hypothetical protein C7H19_20235 [Aphanothece hegewaldii CCALA 016]|uniref:Conjugal transfer protein TrbI n=1 Tax=Aphanothece hegewaldii CCALA 016 TaxID=2107694 RepID=A0A2T1LT86_9CHRO|nr:hypothetical protein [Aphanothece hegewaldii]PSF33329.1 hypothetical protein C7H19_20235 [Aphanothece hegewaldii CCALA 016]